MTLITRLIKTNGDVIIAADDLSWNPGREMPSGRENGSGYGKIKKMVTNKDFAIGLSGNLIFEDFSMIEYLKGILESNPKTIAALDAEFSSQQPNEYKSKVLVFLVSHLQDGVIDNYYLSKTPGSSSFSIKAKKLSGTLFNPSAFKYGSLKDSGHFYQSFNEADYKEYLDFNVNYDRQGDSFHTYFHYLVLQEFGEDGINALVSSSDKVVKAFLIKFYHFIHEQGQLMNATIISDSRLMTIGKCSDIVKISESGTEWLLK